MRRRELQAYVIGAAVAGTALVLPYAGRSFVTMFIPLLIPIDAPFFLLPIAWGAWNVLWVRRLLPCGPAAWGALLGVVIAIAGNLLLAVRGQWTAPLLLLGLWLPAVYSLGWTFVVVPLNGVLDAEP